MRHRARAERLLGPRVLEGLGRRARKALLDGWSLSWIATAYSGYPYSERVTNDVNNDGNRSNDLVPGGRNAQRLPWTRNIDARLSRKIPLGEQARLELIAEAFNLLNSTNISAARRASTTSPTTCWCRRRT